MSYTENFTEGVALLYNLAPISVSNGVEVFTSYVSLANYARAVIKIHVGVMQASGTIDAVVHQGTNTSGGSAKHLTTSKAITQLTQAGGDSGADVCIEVLAEDLDVDGGFDCIALGYTVGTAASIMYIEILGLEPRYKPVTTTNWTEIVD
jgi:hypothetical protein